VRFVKRGDKDGRVGDHGHEVEFVTLFVSSTADKDVEVADVDEREVGSNVKDVCHVFVERRAFSESRAEKRRKRYWFIATVHMFRVLMSIRLGAFFWRPAAEMVRVSVSVGLVVSLRP